MGCLAAFWEKMVPWKTSAFPWAQQADVFHPVLWWLALPLIPWVWSENEQLTEPTVYVISQPSDLAGGISGKRAQCTLRPLFFFLLLISPFGSGICLSGKADMSSLNCVYLLALWCESAPRQLHINLVSVCIYFPLPLSPGLIYGLPFPASCCQWQGQPFDGCSDLRKEQDLSF